jgi:bile acid-coenzyme A ligase
MTETVSFGRRITLLAGQHPGRVAIIFADAGGNERDISWGELEARSNQAARLLAAHGIGQGSMLVVALPNSPEHMYAVIGAWKLGATVLPLRWDLPAWERDRLVALARATAVVADWPERASVPVLSAASVRGSAALASGVLPDRVPNPAKALSSGGSTGKPKLIVTPGPGLVSGPSLGGLKLAMGLADEVTQIILSPFYHMNGFLAHQALQDGHRIVLMERFSPEQAVDLIIRHRTNCVMPVPLMLQRMARVPGVAGRDFSCVEALLCGAAPLPAWVARFWMERVGPKRFYIAYGGTEQIGLTMANGEEWLEHEGTVGRPLGCELQILGVGPTEVASKDRVLPPGEIGEIFMRNTAGAKTFEYIGATAPKATADGYSTFGDLGWVDADGYLYIADRRVDMIVSGGANVYPAEVEAALSEHARVSDAVVIGLPDPEWGRRVHAIIEPAGGAPAPDARELREHCRARLAPYKVPKSFEFLDKLPRSVVGKINRGALIEERMQAASSATPPPGSI